VSNQPSPACVDKGAENNVVEGCRLVCCGNLVQACIGAADINDVGRVLAGVRGLIHALRGIVGIKDLGIFSSMIVSMMNTVISYF